MPNNNYCWVGANYFNNLCLITFEQAHKHALACDCILEQQECNAMNITGFFTLEFKKPDLISTNCMLYYILLIMLYYEFQFSLQLIFLFIYYYSLMQAHPDTEGVCRLLS